MVCMLLRGSFAKYEESIDVENSNIHIFDSLYIMLFYLNWS